MKHFISVVMCGLGLILLLISINQESNKEILFYGYLEQEYCDVFMIPEVDEIIEPERLLQILSATADETSSNIIKTSLIDGDTTGSYELIKYVLIKSDNSPYIQSFSLRSGIGLSSNDTAELSSRKFISTKNTGNNNQIGKLDSFMLNTDVTVYPLSYLFDYVKANGLYYVELNNEITIDEFIITLQDNIEYYSGLKIDANQLIGSRNTIGIPYADLTQYYISFIFVCLFYVLLILYYILRKRRDIAIMKLMGVKDKYIWRHLFSEPLIVYPLFSMVCTVSVLIISHNLQYTLRMMLYPLFFYPFMVVLLLLAYHISNIGLAFSTALKGKNYTRGVLTLHIITELLCVLFVFYSGASAYTDTKQLLRDIEKYKDWTIAENYGVFYPFSIGDDQTEQEEIERDIVIGTELYHYLNSKGALYINSAEFEDDYIELNAATIINPYEQSLKVNPNYLLAYDIFDEKGEKITVNETERALILLVPEKEKENEKEIRLYYQQTQLLSSELDEKYYGISHSDLRQQELTIIWIQNGQKVFTFDDSVNDDIEGVEDPIIVVLTENNSYVCQRIGVLGKGNSDPLKIRLTGTSKETYENLHETLAELGLADNLKSLVSVNERAQESLAIIRANLALSIRLMLILLIMVIYLAYQSSFLLFEKNSKKYVVMHMFGLNWITIYGGPCLFIISMIFILAAFYIVFIKYGGLLYIVLAAFITTMVHLIAMFICLKRQLCVKRSDILKGV